jgi:hypothetical protein
MKKRKFADGGIYTAEMGQPPMEPDGASASPMQVKRPMPAKRPMPTKRPMPMPAKRPMPVKRPTAIDRSMDEDNGGRGLSPLLAGEKFAKGGKVGGASRRADGCATKGKTKGKMV